MDKTEIKQENKVSLIDALDFGCAGIVGYAIAKGNFLDAGLFVVLSIVIYQIKRHKAKRKLK